MGTYALILDMRNHHNVSPQESYLHHLYPNEPNDLFRQARQASFDLNKSGLSLSQNEACLIACLMKMHQCQKVVEVGTLTGYSALWILEGLAAGGTLWTLEKDPAHANAAREIFRQFNETSKDKTVNLVEGDAEETLKALAADGPFDGIFIDGNKSAYCDNLDWAEKNLQKGALVIADNIFLGGGVFTGNTAQYSKKQIEVMRRFNERLADPEKYFSAVVPTEEGLFVAIKLF